MPLINLAIVLIAAGVLLWLVNRYIPMDGKIKNILNGAGIIFTEISRRADHQVWFVESRLEPK